MKCSQKRYLENWKKKPNDTVDLAVVANSKTRVKHLKMPCMLGLYTLC